MGKDDSLPLASVTNTFPGVASQPGRDRLPKIANCSLSKAHDYIHPDIPTGERTYVMRLLGPHPFLPFHSRLSTPVEKKAPDDFSAARPSSFPEEFVKWLPDPDGRRRETEIMIRKQVSFLSLQQLEQRGERPTRNWTVLLRQTAPSV